MFCQGCGTKIEDGARFCTKCGRPVEMPNVEIKYNPQIKKENKKKDTVFQVSSRTPFIYLMTAAAFIFSGVIAFYERAELYGGAWDPYRNDSERFNLLLIGMVAIALAIESLLLWWGSTKVKLIIGEHSISGVRIASGLLTKEFEYDYSEITEIKTSFIGTFLVRVNGKWISFANLEDRKRAKEMIEEKIQ